MNTLALGRAEVLQCDFSYITDTLALFSHLTDDGQRKQTLLLESAAVDTRKHTQSLLLLDAALEIRCQGLTVTIQALTENGRSLMPLISGKMPPEVQQSGSAERLRLTFPLPRRGTDEEQRLKALSPTEVLRTLIQRIQPRQDEPHAIFLGGVFAYDMIASFESLPDVAEGINPCSDMVFYLAETLLVVDHIRETGRLLSTIFGGECFSVSSRRITDRFAQYVHQIQKFKAGLRLIGRRVANNTVSVNVSDQEFCQQVRQLKQKIIAGDVFQVVPSRCFTIQCADSLQAYQQLKFSNPSPFMFYLNDPEFVLFGASPEMALKYSAERRQVEVYPIAGTRKRGKTTHGEIDPDLDSRIELELRSDKKEVAEHLMLVDLARNDLARISVQGSRHVAELLRVDRYSHVMHLVSRVVGTLRADLDALHAYQACMNMGTLVGAPKIRAAELIRTVEKTRRGSYGGAIGYINGEGEMKTCIVIRSACVVDGAAHIQAGAGVVYDSDPQAEADETRSKAQAVIHAIQCANRIVNEASSPRTAPWVS